jgi:8-oxo-dGTP pyrophosphatase MutT (NUDIX family)
MRVATLRPAATVVVVRDTHGSDGFDVLMVRRNDKVAFMAGAYVFPGGRVDETDVERAQSVKVGEPSKRFSDLTLDEELPYRIAAVRELEEEAAVRVDAAALVPIAHWVTPEIETRRFDTRFFLVEMPAGQEARHDEREMTALAWLSPADAISGALRGDLMLPPPTWTTLKRLARHRTLSELFGWAAETRIVRVQPQFLRDETRTMLTLPGDPTYPTIDGWDVPEDTRFLLQEGRWKPVSSAVVEGGSSEPPARRG